MKRSLGLLLALLLATPALAQPDLSPRPRDALEGEARSLPKGKEALAPRVREPGRAKPELTPDGPEARIPAPPDATPRVTRPSSLPSDPGVAAAVRGARAKLLRVDGRNGQVDLRGADPAVATIDWQLDQSDLAVILLRRTRGACPAEGTYVDNVSRQLEADPSLITYHGWSHSRGSFRTDFGTAPFRDLTEVHVQACGIRGNVMNGVASNGVRVLIGSVHRTLRLRPSRWSVEWSHRTEANTVCGLGVDASAIPPPRGTPIGYASRVTRSDGPVPCVRDRLVEYQPSASFDVSGLPRDATIVSAELRFVETDPERSSETGRLCAAATRAVGLANGPVRSGDQVVEAVSRSAEDPRGLASDAGSRRRVDVADWVRAWQRGRSSGVTFLGLEGRHGESACLAQLGDVRIDVEYD